MVDRMRALFRDEEGATMPEYALLVALVAVIAIVGATALGNAVNTKFSTVAGNVTNGQ